MSGKDRKKIWSAALAAIILAGLLIGFPMMTAIAVHNDNLFELGDVQAADILGDDNAANGPDWGFVDGTSDDGLFDATGEPVGLASSGGIAATFLKDETSQKSEVDRTTFSGAGGSNKNNDPIFGAGDTWHWDSGNVPAKDDLVNIYAYATVNPDNDHLVIYAGFERLDPSGDSHIDIEFLQDNIALDEAVPCNDPGSDTTPCSFTGSTTNGRTPGDLIVSMDFTTGGDIGEFSIREWTGTEYILVEPALTTEGCDSTDSACAFNNGVSINGGPWVNLDRQGGEITDIPQNGFTEFGIDVTGLIGEGEEIPCITTFMGKTRSSQSFTAELKDFAGPAGFDICGASISIAPDDVNEVGEDHTFTVTVNKQFGSVEEPADDGTIVSVTLTDANGAVSEVSSDTCASPGTSGGTCSVTFTSNTPGTVTGHASAEVQVGDTTITVETDGTDSNSGDAVKRFVDAFIIIAPDDVNSVGESHTFTATVKQNDGLGGGFVNAPDGTIVTVTLTDLSGAVSSVSSDACASPGTSGGTCSITFTSNTAGTVTGHASVTLTIGGVSLTRSTDGTGSNSGDATKQFIAGTLRWTKVDNAEQLQGGATFQVCRTHNFNSATSAFDPITPVCVNVVDDTDGTVGPGLDQDPDAGQFLLKDLRLGRYTVQETVPPAGFAADPDTVTVDLTVSSPNAIIAEAFVDQRPILKITEFGYTNEPTGTPTSGVVSGTTVYTAKMKNFGEATALLDISLTASIQGGTLSSGTFTYVSSTGPAGVSQPSAGSSCVAGCTASWTDVSLAPGAELTFVITVQYSGVPDGTVVKADLASTYTTNVAGDVLTRTASGSPAAITFTVQSD